MTYRSYLHISIAFDCHEGQRKATRRLGVPGLLRLPCGSCGCRWPGWDGLGRVGTGWDAGIPRENHGKTMEKPRKSPFGHMIYDLMVFHDFSISKCLQEGIFWGILDDIGVMSWTCGKWLGEVSCWSNRFGKGWKTAMTPMGNDWTWWMFRFSLSRLTSFWSTNIAIESSWFFIGKSQWTTELSPCQSTT